MSTDLSNPAPVARLASRVQRVRHELKRRTLTVLRTRLVSPHLRSVTFGGDDLGDFVSLSFDDHVKLFLPVPEGVAPLARDYTPRHFNAAARELTIEFALHGDGPAARWAAQAQPGQTLQIGGPRGSFILPSNLGWHWLVGDNSALPAIARRLEEMPAGTPVTAIVQVSDPTDRRPLPKAAALQLHWVADEAECLSRLRALPSPAGDGYAWCAGEAAAMAAVRRVLVDELGIERHAVRAAAYWKRGVVAHHEDLGD